MIEVRGLNHRIGKTDILRDINLTLPKGQITALIGPNGAGKSTLLSLIARLLPVQSGQISVAGLDLTQTPTEVLAKAMAILPQNAGIASRLRVRELVAFGRWPHHHGRPQEDDQALVAAAITRLGLTDLADRFLDELSGGQRQRAHLAMAFAQGTDWLLLDEPLAALDMAHARGLMQELASLRDAGRSVVMVLHEVNHAAAWADHVVAMKAGRIVAEGPPEAVFTPRVLEPLYDMTLRVEQFEGRPLILHHV
ncbi:MAG: ATP-binding cassette domain-containing protein [Cypionkella sp.]|uniref:iron ABC transporter ATP-binding protein n=1 Tax=Cypionkella sp. TaxID=2811411 RepID=UPI002AB9FBA4|nr:ATP-binding cassette domain-containing protein [Cypionkella sp.]MDZ4309487.1 ATP-binding cassette domain-containing protein [Cypionkella sp.]